MPALFMVTALDQDVDKLMGLRLGADDYVIKPFNPSEVIARVETSP
jgi:two-component system response regulator AdeR